MRGLEHSIQNFALKPLDGSRLHSFSQQRVQVCIERLAIIQTSIQRQPESWTKNFLLRCLADEVCLRELRFVGFGLRFPTTEPFTAYVEERTQLLMRRCYFAGASLL